MMPILIIPLAGQEAVKGEKIGSLRAISLQMIPYISGPASKAVGKGVVVRFTSHIFLSLIDHKCVTTVLLLLFVWFFILVRVNNDPNLRRGS
jgi:hypothetical protein